jgi:hypothetical protein
MENNFLNNLQLYRGKKFSDLVDENMLSEALLTKPHEISTVISYIMGVKDASEGSTIDFLTGGLGKTMISENRQYEWSVLIDADRAVNIKWVKYNDTTITTANAGTLTAGLGNTPILIALEDKWFGPGAIVEFDDKEF